MPSSPATLSLAEALAPATIAQFFAQHWRRSFWHISRNLPGFYDLALSLADLDRHFQSRQLPAVCLSVVRQGERIDLAGWSYWEEAPHHGESVRLVNVDRLLALYAQGATLIVNRAHDAIPPLGDFCRNASFAAGLHARANVYLTPPRAQGFGRHQDGHDICILQIHGSKTWRLHGDTTTELLLQPGDLLYLPLGLEHEACTTDSASIHLSLGLQPAHGFSLVEDLAELARKDPNLQNPLLASVTGSPAPDEQLRAWLAALDLPAVAANHLARLPAREAPSLRQRLADTIMADDLTVDSVVARRADRIWSSEKQDDRVIVRGGTKEISLHRFAAPALEKLRGDASFAVRDLPGLLAPRDKLRLAQDLVRGGLLTIERLR